MNSVAATTNPEATSELSVAGRFSVALLQHPNIFEPWHTRGHIAGRIA